MIRVNIIKPRAIAKAIHKVGIFPAGKEPMRVVPKVIEAFPPLKIKARLNARQWYSSVAINRYKPYKSVQICTNYEI